MSNDSKDNTLSYYRAALSILRRWSLLLSLALFVAAALLGYWSGLSGRTTGLIYSLSSELLPLRDLSPVALLVVIFLNNGLKALAAFVLGFAAGIVPFVFLVGNGFVAGAVVYHSLATKGAAFTTAALLPHGIIEIPAFLLSAALGFQLAGEGLKAIRRRQSMVRLLLGASFSFYLRIVLPALLLAAAIEVLAGRMLGAF